MCNLKDQSIYTPLMLRIEATTIMERRGREERSGEIKRFLEERVALSVAVLLSEAGLVKPDWFVSKLILKRQENNLSGFCSVLTLSYVLVMRWESNRYSLF